MKNSKRALRYVEIWPAFVRIIATFGIFVFHFLGLMNKPKWNIDFYSIMAFSFLTGYFSFLSNVDLMKWIYKRFISILIPYWLVIIPVLFINRIEQYKNTSLTKDMITAFAGNLFIDNPVYVIAWYITFVLMLYVFNFALFKYNDFWKVIILIFGIVIFIKLGKSYYFYSYLSGLVLKGVMLKFYCKKVLGNKFKNILFILQKHCYPFFLVHGGILVFLTVKFTLPPFYIFILSLFNSCILAIFLNKISELLINLIFYKNVN